MVHTILCGELLPPPTHFRALPLSVFFSTGEGLGIGVQAPGENTRKPPIESK